MPNSNKNTARDSTLFLSLSLTHTHSLEREFSLCTRSPHRDDVRCSRRNKDEGMASAKEGKLGSNPLLETGRRWPETGATSSAFESARSTSDANKFVDEPPRATNFVPFRHSGPTDPLSREPAPLAKSSPLPHSSERFLLSFVHRLSLLSF